MIRRSVENDLECIMEIWLSGNLQAHPFVDASYWTCHYAEVKEAIAAGVTVYEKDGEAAGFIGVIDGYIAGLFVKESEQCLGIGKALLDHAKQMHNSLFLHVFAENTEAIRFYEREGFVKGSLHENTDCGCMEYTMSWES